MLRRTTLDLELFFATPMASFYTCLHHLAPRPPKPRFRFLLPLLSDPSPFLFFGSALPSCLRPALQRRAHGCCSSTRSPFHRLRRLGSPPGRPIGRLASRDHGRRSHRFRRRG